MGDGRNILVEKACFEPINTLLLILSAYETRRPQPHRGRVLWPFQTRLGEQSPACEGFKSTTTISQLSKQWNAYLLPLSLSCVHTIRISLDLFPTFEVPFRRLNYDMLTDLMMTFFISRLCYDVRPTCSLD